MDPTEVTTIVSAFEAFLSARAAHLDQDVWFLESCLPVPPGRIERALRQAIQDAAPGLRARLETLYMRLACFVPMAEAKLSPVAMRRAIAWRRRTLARSLHGLAMERPQAQGLATDCQVAAAPPDLPVTDWLQPLFCARMRVAPGV